MDTQVSPAPHLVLPQAFGRHGEHDLTALENIAPVGDPQSHAGVLLLKSTESNLNYIRPNLAALAFYSTSEAMAASRPLISIPLHHVRGGKEPHFESALLQKE